jgi:Cu/Ag efflux pump CusA
VSGEQVGDIFRDGKAYDVQVRSTPETRNSVSDIRALLIDTPRGKPISLDEVADVRVAATPHAIEREDASRRLDVGVDVSGRDLGAVVRDVETRLAQVALPSEYSVRVLGEYAERQAAERRLLLFGMAAALGVFLLLQAAFRSFRLAFLAFLLLPTALVGGLLAAFADGGIISLGSLVGFITVVGIAARNGIMLISHYQHLEEREGQMFGPGLVLRGARERLAPILMTALATGLALLPLVVTGDVPGHEVAHPLAVVILGGLVASTLVNLLIVPSLYLHFGQTTHRRRARRNGSTPTGQPA